MAHRKPGKVIPVSLVVDAIKLSLTPTWLPAEVGQRSCHWVCENGPSSCSGGPAWPSFCLDFVMQVEARTSAYWLRGTGPWSGRGLDLGHACILESDSVYQMC